MRQSLLIAVACLMSFPIASHAAEPSTTPKPIPATRPEIKLALEALKSRTPRLPLPPVAEGEPSVNNGRMRALYLPASWSGTSGGWQNRPRNQGGRPGQEPNALLDYPLTVSCFWIVSRGNNCHYCLGHQELKLRAAGLDDDTIAALDCRWDKFDPRWQAALAYARKLTLEPQLVTADDVAKLKVHFTDPEIIELTFVISRFNATNRWTDSLGIPQDRHFSDRSSELVTPTSTEFQQTASSVDPSTRSPRPAPPSLDEVTAAIAACGLASPRVELSSESQAKSVLQDSLGDRELMNWERAMAQLPETGKSQVVMWNTIVTDDNLPPRLKNELAFISAIRNRSWYAAGHALHRLRQLGATEEEIAALLAVDASSDGTPAHRLAAKLTSDPHLITDADIAAVRDDYSDRETAQIVQTIAMANLFDRFTSALGLPLETSVSTNLAVR